MIPLYQPPRKYRPRYFTPFGWTMVEIVCLAVVVYGIALVWVLAAFK